MIETLLLLPSFLALPTAPQPAVKPASPAALQERTDYSRILGERVQRASELSVDEIWTEVGRRRALVGAGDPEELDAAIDSLLSGEDELGPKGALLLAGLRIQGYEEDVDWGLIAERLTPLIGLDDEVSLGAVSLFSDPNLRNRLGEDRREELSERLIELAEDGDRPPELRVEAAVSAHRVGTGRRMARAQKVLESFRGSADPELHAEGVLGLGRIGLILDIEAELGRLTRLPGEHGQLAAALLEQEEIRRVLQRRINVAMQGLDLSGDSASSEDLDRVERVLQTARQLHLEGHLHSRADLIDAALEGMLQSLDQHSSYFSSGDFKKFEQELEAEYGGIGAYVQEDPDDGLFTITRPIYSGPAYRAKLGTDDKIVRIEDWPTVGKEVDEIIKKLKGRPGTQVKLYVWRRGMDPGLIERPTEDMAVELEREQIKIPPVHSEVLPGEIGVVELSTFSRVAAAELRERIQAMLKQGVRALVLDLRYNTGGLLNEAVAVSELFLPKGSKIVSTENRAGRSRAYGTEADPLLPADMPLVVLVNKYSASASEIVSGALQDHNRATLIGQRTYGKGSVQNLLRLPGTQDDEFEDENSNYRRDNWEAITKDHNGNGEFDFAPRLKLTVERYLLPSGRSIHRELDEEGNVESPGGVEPDKKVDQRRLEAWRLQEMYDLVQKDHTIRDWVRDSFAQNRKLYEQLAYCDMGDPNSYPGFDELYESLDTVLSEEDVRYLLRREVRRLVQDVRGEAFPQGDFEDDPQLQAALRQALAELGESPANVPEYAATFPPEEEAGSDGESSTIAKGPNYAEQREELEKALSLIAEARDSDGSLSGEGLRELSEILSRLKRN